MYAFPDGGEDDEEKPGRGRGGVTERRAERRGRGKEGRRAGEGGDEAEGGAERRASSQLRDGRLAQSRLSRAPKS